MKCRLLRPMPVKNLDPAGPRYSEQPAGTLIDHKNCYHLVRQGVAAPADDECVRAAGMTDAQIAEAALVYREVELGIHPDDRALFRAEKITGYKPDFDPGTEPPSAQYLKGPQWTEADTAACDGEVDEPDDVPA